MKVLSTALAAVLLLCFACNQAGKISSKNQTTTSDVVISPVTNYSRPETNSVAKELLKAPKISKDEEIKEERMARHADSSKDQIFNTEEYANIIENKFSIPEREPLSTFSIDVDAASYSNIRRFINSGSLPPAGAVRLEEMINYFDYSYPQPKGDIPFSVNTELAECPWNTNHQLIHIGLQGKAIATENLPEANLVFLIDVSGSMDEEDKLPLVKTSLNMLVDQLREKDHVAIVVYAGNAGLVLPSTSGSDKRKIREAIDNLEAGGSTAGGDGILLAYKIAKDNFIKGGNNRVILATDGDFNVGVSSDDELVRLIEKERQTDVYLSVLGYGVGNYKDSKMEQLADKGNGNHYYIDNVNEARKVLVSEMGGTLYTIAKDVKIQVEFNPNKVQAYRLIGYENRAMASEDFNNDKKDAGELGSGHRVTALYEVIPVGIKDTFIGNVDDLKYQKIRTHSKQKNGEWMTIKLRYKNPDEDVSRLLVQVLDCDPISLKRSSENFRFSAAVAEFGLLLRNSEYKEQSNYQQVISLAKSSKGNDLNGYRAEFLNLVEKANNLNSIAEK